MVSTNVQEIYDAHIAGLSAAERLRLVELITRGMAEPEVDKAVELHTASLGEMPGWQQSDRRGDMSEWRDREL